MFILLFMIFSANIYDTRILVFDDRACCICIEKRDIK